MQVMCVAKLFVNILPSWAQGMYVPIPEIGSEYTVCGTIYNNGLLYYELIGFVGQEMDARAFATLPEFTADEISELKREGIWR